MRYNESTVKMQMDTMPEARPIDHDDPYAGFASCPDTQRAYFSYSKENHIRWMQKSEETIRDFITKLSTFQNFREAYTYLANMRQQIAIELKQIPENGRADLYGTLRHEGDHYRQSVSAGDGERFWKWQKKKIFELTYQLIEPLGKIKIFNMQPGYLYENKFMTCLKEKVIVDDNNATYYCISIKFPFEEVPMEHVAHSHTLSQIELYDFEVNKKVNLIRIEYTPVDHQNVLGNYLALDKYYQLLLNWRPEEGIDKFFIYAAKIAFLSAHLLIVKHGNSSIIEWLLRAIAYNKGIWLGRFSYADGISWDFKALLTPNINDYAKWFHEKLFVDYITIDPSIAAREFNFQEQK